ncbi:MAG: hypothetical protein ACI915_001181 [Gammaproteobacteria bacterium]|jgi:hypothetical protein
MLRVAFDAVLALGIRDRFVPRPNGLTLSRACIHVSQLLDIILTKLFVDIVRLSNS